MNESFVFYAPEADFLLPYIEREVGKNPGSLAVMISSTEIYAPHSDEILDESADKIPGSKWEVLEGEFLESHPDGIILRAAPIVGTGMTGAMRRLVEEIYSGRFMHFPDNDARKSVVHAAGIAKAVACLVNAVSLDAGERVFNITDNEDPTLHDLAEALAFRMDNKRISNISTRPQQMLAKMLYGKRYRYYTTTERFSCSRLVKALGYTPVSVCNYLRTHVYDNDSL